MVIAEEEVNRATFIKIVREGNATKRCHTLPHVGEYNVGMHSANAVSLLIALWPESKSLRPELLAAVLWHDITERFLGDLPSTAKNHFSLLGEAYQNAERELEIKFKLDVKLTPEEKQWLRGIDYLELYLWCKEQLFMGNQNVSDWLVELELSLRDAPKPIQEFANDYQSGRLNERKLWETLNI